KLRRTDPSAPNSTGPTTEKWILRKACEDLLPSDLVWRKKAQFDEGSGTVEALGEAHRIVAGTDAPLDRDEEAALYEDLLRQQYTDPELILGNAGAWMSGRAPIP